MIWDFRHANSGSVAFHDQRKIILTDEFQTQRVSIVRAGFCIVGHRNKRDDFLLAKHGIAPRKLACRKATAAGGGHYNNQVNDYESTPKSLMSAGPSLTGAAWRPCTCSRICATMSGLASVVMSPVSMLLEIAARTRRMILPLRVLGMSGTM